MNNGKFVISLDFELHWGFFDNRTIDDCRSQLLNVNAVIDELLQLSQQYNVSITFAAVGMLFAKNKNDILKYLPKLKPNYSNNALNSYDLLNDIDEKDQVIYFAQSLVNKIENAPLHEVGTHTFCHYYCNEKGQKNMISEQIWSQSLL